MWRCLFKPCSSCLKLSTTTGENREVHERLCQFVAQVRILGKVNDQSPPNGNRVGQGSLRLFQPARVAEEPSEAVVALGQLPAELKSHGVVLDEMLQDRQPFPEGCFCFLGLPLGLREESSHGSVAGGSILTKVGSGREVFRQLLADCKSLRIGGCRFIHLAQLNQQNAKIMACSGEVLAKFHADREFGNQELVNADGFAPGSFALILSPGATKEARLIVET